MPLAMSGEIFTMRGKVFIDLVQRFYVCKNYDKHIFILFGNYIQLYTESSYYKYSDSRRLWLSRQSRVHRCYPPPKSPAYAGDFCVGTRKDIRLWDTVSVKLYVITFFLF